MTHLLLGLQLLLRIFQQPERDGVRGFEIINTRAQAQATHIQEEGGGGEDHQQMGSWIRRTKH